MELEIRGKHKKHALELSEEVIIELTLFAIDCSKYDSARSDVVIRKQAELVRWLLEFKSV